MVTRSIALPPHSFTYSAGTDWSDENKPTPTSSKPQTHTKKKRNKVLQRKTDVGTDKNGAPRSLCRRTEQIIDPYRSIVYRTHDWDMLGQYFSSLPRRRRPHTTPNTYHPTTKQLAWYLIKRPSFGRQFRFHSRSSFHVGKSSPTSALTTNTVSKNTGKV